MNVKDFAFELPDELIARYPQPERSASRLLCLDGPTGQVQHQQFKQIVEQLQAGDLLVFNDTRVIPARLLGEKVSGGKVEVLVERIIDEHRARVHLRSNRSPKAGARMILEGAVEVEMLGRNDALFELYFHTEQPLLEVLEQFGHMPLPPYIDRPDEASDKERYQTVYNKSRERWRRLRLALHFDETILQQLRAKGESSLLM